MFLRENPCRSMALAATMSACVESSPPETPMMTRWVPVLSIRFISGWTRML